MGKNNHIILLLVLIVIVMIWGFIFLNHKIQINRFPPEEDWLAVYTKHIINKRTDFSLHRVAVNVTIYSEDADGKALVPKEMIITMTSALGQENISQNIKNEYIQDAERAAKDILDHYGLSKEYRPTVQYILD